MDNFKDKIKKYKFIDACYTVYIDKWPKLEVILTSEHIKKLNQTNIDDVISKAEFYANETHPINVGIIGTTKKQLIENQFIIQGSETVIDKVIESIF